MYIRVKAEPNAKRESVKKISEDTYEISVREPAERNLANGRIKELLAKELVVSTSSLRMISGHRSPSKIFSVTKK